MLRGRRLPGWTALVLATTVFTSVTGFFFVVDRLWPSHGVGIISLVALTVTSLGLDGVPLAGSWRWSHVVCAVLSFDLNGFVGVVQAFQKLPFLGRLAPTQSGAPFVIAPLVVMAIIVVLGIRAVMRFRPMAMPRA